MTSHNKLETAILTVGSPDFGGQMFPPRFSIVFMVGLSLAGILGGDPQPQTDRTPPGRTASSLLRIQIQDAAKAEADKLIEEIRGTLTREDAKRASIERNDPKSPDEAQDIEIIVRGLPGVPVQPAYPSSAVTVAALISRTGIWEARVSTGDEIRIRIPPLKFAKIVKDVLAECAATLEWRFKVLGVPAEIRQIADRPELSVKYVASHNQSEAESLTIRGLFQVTYMMDGPHPTRDAGIAAHGGAPLVGTMLMLYRGLWFLLHKEPVLSNSDVKDAVAVKTAAGNWGIELKLQPEGARRLALFTEANVGTQLATIWEGGVVDIEKIERRIDGNLTVAGQMDREQAAITAILLRSGSLPARLIVSR